MGARTGASLPPRADSKRAGCCADGSGDPTAWRSIVRGEDALAILKSFGRAGRRLRVACKYRDDSWSEGTIDIQLGIAKGKAFYFFNDCGDRISIATSAADDAAKLFATAVSYLEMCTSLVNSDPRSPEYFESKPSAMDMPEVIRKTFSVQVDSSMW